MKKIILAGASAVALLSASGAAQAQLAVDVILGPGVTELFADEDFAGVYINAAVQAAPVNGSVNIDAAPLVDIGGIGAINASRIGFTAEGSSATATAGLTGVTATATGTAAEIGIEIVGNSIASTGVLATTAIGAVNDGTIALGQETASLTVGSEFIFDDRGGLEFDEAASDSAANTSNTAARAAASATSLGIDAGSLVVDRDFFQVVETGPAQVIAANVALSLAPVNASVNVSGATTNALAGADTTAIGAVNTGVISNGLPGSITIEVD